MTCKPRVSISTHELVPPWIVEDEAPGAERWGENGVRAAHLFASLIGCGYLALERYFEERIGWLAEQERAGTMHQVLGPDVEQTIALGQLCHRAVQTAGAWTYRLAGDQLGELRRLDRRVLAIELDLRGRTLRLEGHEAYIGNGQALYLLAALAMHPGRRQSAGELTENMRRLGYSRYQATDSTFDLCVAKSRLLTGLRKAANGRADTSQWIEGNHAGLTLTLRPNDVHLARYPLLPARKHAA